MHELINMLLTAEKPGDLLLTLHEQGQLKCLPEVAALALCAQDNPYHCEGNALKHTALALDAWKKHFSDKPYGRRLFWAVLLHDIGKPGTAGKNDKGHDTYYTHAAVGELLVPSIVIRFDIPPEIAIDLVTLVREHHLFINSMSLDDKKSLTTSGKKFARLGIGGNVFTALVKCDLIAQDRLTEDEIDQKIEAITWGINEALRLHQAEVNKQADNLVFNGAMLKAVLAGTGLNLEGKKFGQVLVKVRDAIRSGELQDDTDQVRDFVQQVAAQ
jgi:hypothetical protein